MAKPAFPKARFYAKRDTGEWLAEFSTQMVMSVSDDAARCAAIYGFPVVAVETSTLPRAQVEALAAARIWGGAPPGLPTVQTVGPERIMPPSRPPTESETQRARLDTLKAKASAWGLTQAEVNEAVSLILSR